MLFGKVNPCISKFESDLKCITVIESIDKSSFLKIPLYGIPQMVYHGTHISLFDKVLLEIKISENGKVLSIVSLYVYHINLVSR